MKRTIFTLLFSLSFVTLCLGQTLEMKKNFFGDVYLKDGERISKQELKSILEPNNTAYELYRKSRSTRTLGDIIAFGGGFMIGIPLGQSIANSPDPNWTLGGVGLGISILGAVISKNGDKKAREAIEYYNSSKSSTSAYRFEPEFKIIANGYGLGLSMDF